MASISNASSSFCCVCRSPLAGAKGKGRHKKLRGNSCNAERTVWEQLAMEFDCYSTVQQSFLSDQAILCYCCIGKASKFSKLQNHLFQQKEEMACVLRDNRVIDTNTQPGSSEVHTPQRASSSEIHTPRRVKRAKAPAVPPKRVKTSVRQPSC